MAFEKWLSEKSNQAIFFKKNKSNKENKKKVEAKERDLIQ